jgi:cell division septation protein DedD
MSQTDGEKELVLGNKQLISLFFVVVALCGIFFAMGYMIGRNTSKPATANLDSGASGTPAPVTADTPRSPDSEPPRETASDVPPSTTAPATDTPPQVSTVPSSAAASAPAPAVQTSSSHETPSHEAPAHETPAHEAPAREAAAVPQPGATYLQVTALRRTDADNLVKTLREQNLPAVVAASSKPDLFRVLVGPYHQTADVADAKSRLKSLGFANAFVQK